MTMVNSGLKWLSAEVLCFLIYFWSPAAGLMFCGLPAIQCLFKVGPTLDRIECAVFVGV